MASETLADAARCRIYLNVRGQNSDIELKAAESAKRKVSSSATSVDGTSNQLKLENPSRERFLTMPRSIAVRRFLHQSPRPPA